MNHTVLVVEDEEDLRETMREALELNGYTVVVAGDGQDSSSPKQAPAGAARVLAKPLRFDQLISVVHEFCDH